MSVAARRSSSGIASDSSISSSRGTTSARMNWRTAARTSANSAASMPCRLTRGARRRLTAQVQLLHLPDQVGPVAVMRVFLDQREAAGLTYRPGSGEQSGLACRVRGAGHLHIRGRRPARGTRLGCPRGGQLAEIEKLLKLNAAGGPVVDTSSTP